MKTAAHAIAVILFAVAVGVVSSPDAVAAPRCQGRVATILGTANDDDIVGTAADDVIVSRGGWDTIESRGGNDRICSGADPDFIRGGPGRDRIVAGAGSDTAHGGTGDDVLRTGAGAIEALFGARGSDRLFAGTGSFDGLIGGRGDDLLDGGRGRDLAEFFDAGGPVQGDLETDRVTGHGDDRLRDVEGLVGSNFDDVLLGDQVSNLLVGQEGADVLDARGSGPVPEEADVLDGGPGDDDLIGGDGGDIVRFEDSPDPVTVDLAEGAAVGWGIDQLDGIEAAIGSDLDDTLIGNAGDNALVGGSGDDTLDGAGGVDLAVFADAFEPVVVDLSTGTATGWGSDTLTGIEDVLGTADSDVITGDAGPNAISGGSGADLLTGRAGDDVLVGNGGTDVADGGDGSDACDAETEVACESGPVAGAFGAWSVVHERWRTQSTRAHDRLATVALN
jgi:Ca2+-binding RTX toxin-like protein